MEYNIFMENSKIKKNKSVITFITVFVAVGILFYSAILFLLVNRSLHSSLEAYFTQTLEEKSDVMMEEIAFSQEQALRTVNWAKEMCENSEPSNITEDFINNICESAVIYFDVDTISFFDANGNQISAKKYGSNVSEMVLKPILRGQDYSDLERFGNDVFAISGVPVEIDGNVIGAFVGRGKVTTNDLIETVKDYTSFDSSIFNGYIRNYTTLDGYYGKEIQDKTIIDRVKNGECVFTKSIFNNIDYISYYFPLLDSNGNFLTTLFMGTTLDVIDITSQAIFKSLMIVIAVASIILLVSIIMLLIWKVGKPLKKVERAMQELSSGHADLTIRLPENGNDEFSYVCKYVNSFISLLQNIINDLRKAQESLEEIGESLGANSQETASATAQIFANIEGVRKQSQNQENAVKNTTNVLNLSSNTAENLGNFIEFQASGITESSVAIEQMLGNISSVTQSVRKMASSFNELELSVDDGNSKLINVGQKVSQIAEQSKMLNQANAIISQIASETNLLAMNAAIEAAHAGEAGKGFSVVADEIRKLAETSSKQSKNINVELKDIATSIKDVVTLSKESQEKFSEIVGQLSSTTTIIKEIDGAMTEQETASRQILESLASMKSQSEDVKEKSAEMKDDLTNVSSDMSSVAQISTTVLSSMDEMSIGVQEISNSTQMVSELAFQSQEQIKSINELLKQFRT